MTKILLVEDDNNLREIYGARLEAEGYDIAFAQDGEEALSVAVKEKPDLIVSDVMMPKISGFDMLDILRNTPETANTRVIMMTALSQSDDKARADKLGADRYLVKSQVTLEDVVKTVSDVLAQDDQQTADIVSEQATAEPAIAPEQNTTPQEAQPQPEAEIQATPVQAEQNATFSQPEETTAPQVDAQTPPIASTPAVTTAENINPTTASQEAIAGEVQALATPEFTTNVTDQIPTTGLEQAVVDNAPEIQTENYTTTPLVTDQPVVNQAQQQTTNDSTTTYTDQPTQVTDDSNTPQVPDSTITTNVTTTDNATLNQTTAVVNDQVIQEPTTSATQTDGNSLEPEPVIAQTPNAYGVDTMQTAFQPQPVSYPEAPSGTSEINQITTVEAPATTEQPAQATSQEETTQTAPVVDEQAVAVTLPDTSNLKPISSSADIPSSNISQPTPAPTETPAPEQQSETVSETPSAPAAPTPGDPSYGPSLADVLKEAEEEIKQEINTSSIDTSALTAPSLANGGAITETVAPSTQEVQSNISQPTPAPTETPAPEQQSETVSETPSAPAAPTIVTPPAPQTPVTELTPPPSVTPLPTTPEDYQPQVITPTQEPQQTQTPQAPEQPKVGGIHEENGKKVINPINDVSSKPDLNALLAKEQENAAVLNPSVNTVVQPTQAPPAPQNNNVQVTQGNLPPATAPANPNSIDSIAL